MDSNLWTPNAYALSTNEPWKRQGSHNWRSPYLSTSKSAIVFFFRGDLYDESLETSISNIITVSSLQLIFLPCLLQRNETKWKVRWKLHVYWSREICKYSSGNLIIGCVDMIGIRHFRVGLMFLSRKNTRDIKRRKKNKTPVLIFLALRLK